MRVFAPFRLSWALVAGLMLATTPFFGGQSAADADPRGAEQRLDGDDFVHPTASACAMPCADRIEVASRSQGY